MGATYRYWEYYVGTCMVVRTMAMRECLSSAARYQARVSADAILEKPIGSKTLPPVSTPTPSLNKEVRRR